LRAQRAQGWSKEDFNQTVERHLTGQEAEPWEIIYFELYKRQLPGIEEALQTAALMAGSDKSWGYCLEMISADFLARAHLQDGNPLALRVAFTHLYRLLPDQAKQEFLTEVAAPR
jgi:hypothetical protein